MNPRIPGGFFVLHSNLAERLLDLLVELMARYPLPPLEKEVFLVHNATMAQWLEVQLSHKWGICAGVKFVSPNLFLHQLHQKRRVITGDLDEDQNEQSLTWQILKLVPKIDSLRTHFSALSNERQKFQKARRIALHLMEYQMYRPDWLHDWLTGKEVLRLNQQSLPVPESQLWQVQLWQLLNIESSDEQKASWPIHVLAKTLQFVKNSPEQADFPQRICVFGGLRLSPYMLSLLQALSPRSQVFLTVINPCQEDWVESWHLSGSSSDTLTDVIHPRLPSLLLDGGKPIRDYLLQLNSLELLEHHHLQRIDIFDNPPIAGESTLLGQLQARVRTLATHHPSPLKPVDESIQFVSCHSIYRELEVLHDQVLRWLQQDPHLRLQDIHIAIPNLVEVTPEIQAVFGRYAISDNRFIPYAIAETQSKDPIQTCLPKLLLINKSKMDIDEFFDLLSEPVFVEKYTLESDTLLFLKEALYEAHARWGLDAQHRLAQGLGHPFAENSLLYGINRLLMGEITGPCDSINWSETQSSQGFFPFATDLGIDSDVLTMVAQFWHLLKTWSETLNHVHSAPDWRDTLTTLLTFTFNSDFPALANYLSSLQTWVNQCQSSGYNTAMTLDLVYESWLLPLTQTTHYASTPYGKLQFSDIGLMRGIPCKILCMLGMNEQVFPHLTPPSDIDLIALSGMPKLGDRSHLEDDRELMLLALLSARQKWYLSWSGNNEIDDSPSLPSILVQRLQDEIQLIWGNQALPSFIQKHPLQAFSLKYFDATYPNFTFSKEWQGLHKPQSNSTSWPKNSARPETPIGNLPPVNMTSLYEFWRDPIKAYVQTHWHAGFTKPPKVYELNESMAINPLQEFHLFNELFATILYHEERLQPRDAIDSLWRNWQINQSLPVGAAGQHGLAICKEKFFNWYHDWQTWRSQNTRLDLPRAKLEYVFQDIKLVLNLPWSGLHLKNVDTTQYCWLTAQSLNEKKPSSTLYKLFPYWLEMLFFAALGYPQAGVVISPGQKLTLPIPPLAPLKDILSFWRQGQTQIMPLPIRTAVQGALATLGDHSNQTVMDTYEGTNFTEGEKLKLLGFGRFYERLADLQQDPLYAEGIEKIYNPFTSWAQTVVGLESV
ncbi:MAG: exodeoxyribonuclease V subunit gamma [Gammaproteobacteria bacterium]|nr:exodeoxyribonuclease V subunit gamma [Gammaproteobacteria bacterium]